jgi:DNA-binding MarR family transcriptional regulator
MRRGSRPRRTKHRAAVRPGPVDIGALTCLIGYMLRRAQIAVFQDVFRAFAEVGIRPAQFSVLTVIAHNPGRTQSQTSAALGIKRTNFVALIDSLERRGLAERRPARSDRRSHALHLTAAGKTAVRRLNRMVDKLEAGMVRRIGRGRRAVLLDLLSRLAQGERHSEMRGDKKPYSPRHAPRKRKRGIQ